MGKRNSPTIYRIEGGYQHETDQSSQKDRSKSDNFCADLRGGELSFLFCRYLVDDQVRDVGDGFLSFSHWVNVSRDD
jgi:hypothetical protein